MRTRSQYYRREPRSSRTRHRAPPEDGQEEDLYIPSDSESEESTSNTGTEAKSAGTDSDLEDRRPSEGPSHSPDIEDNEVRVWIQLTVLSGLNKYRSISRIR